MLLSFSVLLLTIILSISAHTPAEWRSRTIYQIITDRFAKSDGSTEPCSDLHSYCGGTFQGIINSLDYIEGMGFDAIWISPVITNTPGGYHGYWAQDIFEINPYFGGADGLISLVEECHKRDIWVMVDVVANHMGNLKSPGNFSDLYPFNDPSHYHPDVDCSMVDPNNQTAFELCWLAQLPDLNQDNPFVRSQLLSWIKNLVRDYNLDGLRIDTVPYVSKDFWKEFTESAGVYTVGEVFNGYLPYDAGYEGPVDGILNYPYYFTIRSVFQKYGDMNYIEGYYQGSDNVWPDLTVLGNFVNNHDNPRFLNEGGDQVAFKAALAFSLTSVGIPIIYYGDEQAYAGGPDPGNREPLWTNMNPKSEIYDYLATIINFRKEKQIYMFNQVQRYSDASFYAFTRGEYFFAFTNTQNEQVRNITYHPYADGTILCNLFYPHDTVKVENGQFSVYLEKGEVKIFLPQQPKEEILDNKLDRIYAKLEKEFLEK